MMRADQAAVTSQQELLLDWISLPSLRKPSPPETFR
jgi:hypothetical protein